MQRREKYRGKNEKREKQMKGMRVSEENLLL